MTQLPGELLWTIMGFMDVRSLCTARLVCKQFRDSASAHVKALEVDCKELYLAARSNFTQFAGLTRLVVVSSVFGGGAPCMRLVALPSIAPFVTHVNMFFFSAEQRREVLPHLMLLPKLRSLRLRTGMDRGIPLPSGLEELHLERYNLEGSITRLSGVPSHEVCYLGSLETL